MNLVKQTAFGKVEAIRLGFGPIGPPLMSVFLYVVDGLVIDTGQHNMQKVVVELLKAKKLDQIASLKKILEFDFEVLFCAHNPCLENGRSRLKHKLQFLEDLYGSIHRLIQKGFPEREVIKKLDPKNDRLIRWVTMGNVSFANMIRSGINAVT
jgi:hypothetical protein